VSLHSEDQIVWYLSSNGSPIGPMTIGSLKERLRLSAQWGTEYVWCEGYSEWVLARDVEQLKRQVPPPLKLRPSEDVKSTASSPSQSGGFKKKLGSFLWWVVSFFTLLAMTAISKEVIKNASQSPTASQQNASQSSTASQQMEDALKQTVILSRTKMPIKVDDATSIIELSSVGTKLVYRLVTTVYNADFAGVKVNLTKSVCPSYLNKLLQNGATIEHRYEKPDQTYVGRVTLTKQDCGPYEGKD
jgi:hypothetical protein